MLKKSKLIICFMLVAIMLQGIVVFAAEYREDNESIPGWNVIYKYADGKAVVSGDEKHSGKASMKIINNTPNNLTTEKSSPSKVHPIITDKTSSIDATTPAIDSSTPLNIPLEYTI